jgi:hypothetical protein
MFCVPAIIFHLFFFLWYTRPHLFVEGEKREREGKSEGRFFLLSWTWGACHGLEVLFYLLLLYYPVTLYLYIWCLVVEISSTATMPVERR